MNIVFKTKEENKEKHIYSFIARLDAADFDNKSIIKELVLKIKVPSILNWEAKNGNIKTKQEEIDGKEYLVFEIRRKNNLYLQDMPLEIIGPKSDIGEILYFVTDENHYLYQKDYLLLWDLYGEGILTQNGTKKLKDLQKF
jgi:hypothetical protein